MSLLADSLGYARLAEPVRFRHAWEQQASLRIRNGRIIGGNQEEIMDAAAAAYVALSADGTDTLLMAADHALRRELNRRIREDLITLGVVSSGPAVTIADATRASPGDLLRIEAITPDGLFVRRALDADPRTGQRRWTDRHFLFNCYENSELGYAVTDANFAHVFTRSLKSADPAPGPKPAPELARYDRIHSERAGHLAPATEPAPPGTALGVLAAVLDHDGQQFSAAQTRHQALADADHLAILHAIWAAETNPARESSALS